MKIYVLHSGQPSARRLAHHLGCASGTELPEQAPPVIVQWGNAGLSRSFGCILNGSLAIRLAMNCRLRERLLSLNAIPVLGMQEKAHTIRRYHAIVFQQEVVALYKASGISLREYARPAPQDELYKEIDLNVSSRELRYIMQFAVRSVYCLGLDFACVQFGVRSDGGIRVLDVMPAFSMHDDLAVRMAELIAAFANRYTEDQSTTIIFGADPEFMLADSSGRMLSASEFFPRFGRVGCDRVVQRDQNSPNSLPVAELRPEPAATPKDLFRNLYRAMLLGIKKTAPSDAVWLAGGMPFAGYPLGGHIHFSGIAPNSQLLRALDTYLALPVFMLEGEGSMSRRPRYGFPGDFRKAEHGGFEYRSLPSWLCSPKATRGIFALSVLIAASYRSLKKNLFIYPSVQRAFFTGSKIEIARYIPDIWEEIEALPLYGDYMDYLSPFKHQIWGADAWEEGEDIRLAWKLPPYNNWYIPNTPTGLCYNTEGNMPEQEREVYG
ncbi:hypothetical protein PP175_09725 [Aneurinibacillus sp. Ricciae_BoGa-3]|uniref:putative amidoligase domain-containing protein n=1 Tax=Aneurinibacillus sp. Ricciae_BoGa-3 TaxID=3022697 RepID=UPI0023406FA4|nr:hypothetical protein [Aneurinibacillus sp. Ricciae_BoGa-3]WCK56160.1 hypothetical protein PP175_09725 [Aneurinibacillus sp. Ricciae_BoGa-3]